MNIYFLMYPWEKIKPEKDSSLTLIHECSKRGHGVAICASSNLTIRNSVTNAFYTIINRMEKVLSSHKSYYKKATTREEILPLADFDAIFMRTNPPLDPLMLNFLDWVKDGLCFVGIDVINGKLVEVNVMSPGGITYINKVSKVKLQEKVVDFLESKILEKNAAFRRMTNLKKQVNEA